METIKVSKVEVIKAIENGIKDCARKGEAWSGWGVDVIIHKSGNICLSDQNNGNVVYQNGHKFCRIKQEDRKKPTAKDRKNKAIEMFDQHINYFNETVNYLRTKGIDLVIE